MTTQEYFLKQYTDIHSKFTSVLDLIEHLNQNFPKMADTHLHNQDNELEKYLIELKKQDQSTYDEATTALKKFESGQGYDLNKMSKKSLDTFIKLIDNKAIRQASQTFIREMALIHIITTFNEFLKDTLAIAFSLGDKTKNAWKTMSDDDKEKTVTHLVEHDIKEAAVELRKNFDLDLKKQNDWEDFAECFYRRHVFIHNRGFPSQKYRDRTHYSGNNTKLEINRDYLIKVIPIFKKYSDLIEEYFIEKQLFMVNVTKKSNIINVDLTKGGGTITKIDDSNSN